MSNDDLDLVAPSPFPDAPAEAGADPSDRCLLNEYVNRRDETAFALLVHRYGPLVLAVCRRVLGHEQDAEDAFQATFLVLARQAGAIRKSASMSSWLYRVAYRVARKLKGQRVRRQIREREVPERVIDDKIPEWVWRDLRAVLDEEVNRLPLKYRQPFILCYLDGKTNEEAARQLAWPIGTVASRLTWARERLRVRLTRRGVVLSAGSLAGGLTAHAGRAAVPGPLAGVTIRTGIRFGSGHAGTAGVAVRLARAYIRGAFYNRFLRRVTAVLALLVGASLLVGLFGLLFHKPAPTRAKVVRQVPRPVFQPRTDLERIQGTWKVAGWELGGQRAPAEGARFVVNGNTGELHFNGDTYRMTFELNPAAEPKRIDLVLLWLGSAPAQGIYALDGEGLRICYSWGGLPRPTAFVAHPGAKEMLYELRRK
jgi:RNA polymerase sigma-70 factor (ECF subfamily)